VYIPKVEGQLRPLGIAARADKMVQQAVVTILNQISEEDFLGFSYGYRPRRSPPHARDALAVALTRKGVHYVLEYDIGGFLDTLSHEWLVRFRQPRVADPRILRLIQKWWRAGVSEDAQWSETKVGGAQGAVASPFLANVYLHYVCDLWVAAWPKRVAQGEVVVVRFADDGGLGLEHRGDAERFLEALRQRVRKFGLELHPDKTRLIEFGPHALINRQRRGEGKPETCDFLGFTHIGERHPRTGYFLVRRKTARQRMVAKLKAIQPQWRSRRHEPIAQTGQWLGSVVQGYFNSHAVPGNMRTLGTFRRRVLRLWRRQLRLRSQKTRLNWQRLGVLIHRWIPTQRILPPFPSVRFDATHPR
jgi:RNA-directed DNA polymerase